MTKVTVFNDTQVDWPLHIGSMRGSKGEDCIPQRSAVDFEAPDGSDMFVKVWDSMAMVRYSWTPAASLADRVSRLEAQHDGMPVKDHVTERDQPEGE